MDWRDVAKNVVPTLAGFLPPPFNGLAQVAVKSALGLSEDCTDRELRQAVKNATPDQLLALKQAENQFQIEMEKLGVDLEKIASDDRSSARNLSKHTKSFAPVILTIMATLLLGAELVYIILAGGIPATLDNAFGGALLLAPLTLAQQGFNFFLGSSSGSQKKDNIINGR